jgi:cytoskeleton protein RodZ
LTEPSGTGVGGELARAREAHGLALADVAQQLKFAPRQLEALEQERFDLLPGGTFVRGMVRSYARLLKLDADPLVGRIADRFDAPDSNRLADRYRQPVPFSDNARRSTLVYLGLSLGILAAVGGVAYEWYHERPGMKQLAGPAPAAAQRPVEAPHARPLPLPPQAVPAQQASAKLEGKTMIQENATVGEKTVALQLPRPAGVHRIVLRCEEEAWLEVTDALGRQLLSSLNPAGAERVVQGRPPFSLVIGNASHVRISYNERPVDLQPHTKVEVARFTLP